MKVSQNAQASAKFRRGEPTLRFPELRYESIHRMEGTVNAYQKRKCYYDDNTNNSYPGQRTSIIFAKPIPAWN